ncbi:MAG: hypothetical protein AAGE98_02680 [Actinomycetota bacterium]
MRIRLALVAFVVSLAAACGGGEPEHSVLFVGNSLTFGNDVPSMVAAIADANGVPIEWEMIASGGARLSDHRADPAVERALRSGDFDVVVFQEQSEMPSVPHIAESQTIPAAVALDAIADAAGVRVIWYQTWGHRNGSAWSGHASYDTMFAEIADTYAEIGRVTGGEVAGAGWRWDRVLSRGIAVDLYDSDGYHASPAGSYLAAVAIADTLLVGQSLSEAPSVGGVDGDTAWLLMSS